MTCRREEGENVTCTVIDRISSLPDALLIEILSPLPTFSVVATSVLSKRWRNLWTRLSHLRFSFKDFTSKEIFQIPYSQLHQSFNRYLTTIDKILPRLTSPKIHVFQLTLTDIRRRRCCEYDWTHCSNLVRAWLAQICARNPDVINVKFCHVQYQRVIRVPSCVFQCQSLISLHFGGGFDFDFNYISLPKLKNLSIVLVDEHRKLMATLFKSCPMLEDLRISANLHFIQNDDHLVDISSHNLKGLHLESVGYSDNTMFLIDAPNLEEIVISCHSGLISYQVVSKFNGLLHKADFNIYSKCSEETIFKAAKLVKELGDCAQSLKLRGYTIQCLDLAEVNGKATIFSSLTELDFQTWSNFMVMLHCCPNLEKIVWPTYFDFQNVAKDLKESKVPSCLSKNVKRIIVGCLKGTTEELDVLKYILTYAEVLEHLTVEVDDYYTRKEVVSGIGVFSPALLLSEEV